MTDRGRSPAPRAALAAVLLGLLPPAGAASAPQHDASAAGREVAVAGRAVKAARALSGDRFVTEEGTEVVLDGVQAPRPDDEGTVVSHGGRAARRRLEELVCTPDAAVFLERERRLHDGRLTADVRLSDGRLASVVLASEGWVRPAFDRASPARAPVEAAARRARRRAAGVHARPPRSPLPRRARHKGVSMGLYSRDDDFDYRPSLDAAVRVGATHVLFVVPRFMEGWRSTSIEPVRHRTAPFRTVDRVARRAHDRGLRVALMPIVLLKTGTKEHWRGDIEPECPDTWWHNYTRMVCEWADVARDVGAGLLVVGSEFSSLEEEERRWRRLIATARLRFDGLLSYSANWDHYRHVGFWDELDVAGMTAYHSLTDEDDPTLEELLGAWKPIRERLLRFQSRVRKPILFTEVGYASQDGINKDPWNYYISQEPDPAEQADCFQAFIRTWRDPPEVYAGAYFYDWWSNDDDDDRVNYSIRGKPAERTIRRYFRGKRL